MTTIGIYRAFSSSVPAAITEVPQTRGLNNKHSFSGFWRLEFQIRRRWSVSDETPLLGLQSATFLLCPRQAERASEISSLSKGLILVIRAPSHDLLTCQSPTLGTRLQYMNWKRRKHSVHSNHLLWLGSFQDARVYYMFWFLRNAVNGRYYFPQMTGEETGFRKFDNLPTVTAAKQQTRQPQQLTSSPALPWGDS